MSPRIRKKPSVILLAAITALALPAGLQAQLYWDVNGSTAGAANAGNADGTWSTSDANWSSDASGGSATGLYASGSNVIFSAGSDTTAANITLSTTQTAATLTVDEGAYTFGGNTLTLSSGAGTVTVNSGASATFANTVTLSATPNAFTVDGTLSFANVTGGKIINLSGSGSTTFTAFDGTLNVLGGTAAVNTTTNGKFKGGTISSGAKLTLGGNAALVNGATITLNGTLEIKAGNTLASTGFLNGSGTLIGEAGSSFTVGSSDKTSTFTGNIEGAGNFIKTGTGNFTFGGTSTSTGDITVGAGTYTLGSDGQLTFTIGDNGVNNAVNVTGGTADFNGSFDFNLDGADLTDGNSWTIVDVTSGGASYGDSFVLLGFSETTEGSGVWVNGGFTYDTVSGVLTFSGGVIPEPSAVALLGGLAALGFAALRRRTRAS